MNYDEEYKKIRNEMVEVRTNLALLGRRHDNSEYARELEFYQNKLIELRRRLAKLKYEQTERRGR